MKFLPRRPLAQCPGDPCISVLLGISAEASGARTGAETVMVGEFGIEAAFIVAPGTPPT
jgi:hypothetical protein